MHNEDEIKRIEERTYRNLLAVTDEGDPEQRVSDLIANLAIYAHENDLGVADLVVRGLAHYAATYIEGMEPEEAGEWLNDALFGFTGERQFAEYVADQAIVLGGKAGRIESPEWGI